MIATAMGARRLRGTPQWSTVVRASYVAAVVIVVLFAATSALAALDYAVTPGPRLAGLAERAYLTTAFAWIFVVACHAISALDPGNDRAIVASVRRP